MVFFLGDTSPWFVVPNWKLSIGQARVYWGKKLAFAAGFEIFRGEAESLPLGFPNSRGGFTSELIVPEVGISFFKSPPRSRILKFQACKPTLIYTADYMPRFDVICGFALFNPVYSRKEGDQIRFCPTLKAEARLFITRSIQAILENKVEWSYSDSSAWEDPANTTSFSLCLSLGNDYLIDKAIDQEHEGE